MVNYDALHQHDNKNLVAKKCKKMQSMITQNCCTPNCQDPFSVVWCELLLQKQKEGRVPAVVAKEQYHKATKNQAQQRFKHSAESFPQ